ncbi:MAG: roadblock/LC7 domain-containing protein [Thermoplasmatota archaeon]
MIEGTPVVVDKNRNLTEALAALSSEPGIRGAVLATRDGLCVVNGLRGLVRPETFSAMAAATCGAAEAALAETSANVGSETAVVMESGVHRILALPASEELLLVMLADTSATLDTVMASGKRAVQRIAKIVAE